MLTKNREYSFIGELTLNRSSVLDSKQQPKDDKVNWLFLNTGTRQFSFVYEIENTLTANYGKPFKIYLAFTMTEDVKDILILDHNYEVLRGQEAIGMVRLINYLE